MEVFITVPHGYCPEEEFRVCDTRASFVGTVLTEEMRRLFGDKVVIRTFYANKPRSYGDLNRPEMRNTKWRREIQTKVEQAVAKKLKVLLYDIHSFPDDSTSFRTNSVQKSPQVVLLEGETKPSKLPKKIESETSVDLVTVLRASLINDITVQSRIAGAEAMLWEFNESAERLTDEQVREVAVIMAKYAQEKLK